MLQKNGTTGGGVFCKNGMTKQLDMVRGMSMSMKIILGDRNFHLGDLFLV